MAAASVAVVVTSGERYEGNAGMVLFAGISPRYLTSDGLSGLCIWEA